MLPVVLQQSYAVISELASCEARYLVQVACLTSTFNSNHKITLHNTALSISNRSRHASQVIEKGVTRIVTWTTSNDMKLTYNQIRGAQLEGSNYKVTCGQ